jgi:hypothetical protein
MLSYFLIAELCILTGSDYFLKATGYATFQKFFGRHLLSQTHETHQGHETPLFVIWVRFVRQPRALENY